MLDAHREALGRAIDTVLGSGEIATESVNVNDAVADPSSFGAAITALSAADLAFIDVTGFEPGVMLLLGIRSVLRPGVTLMTTREKFEAHHWSLLPFNLKEMYPLCIKPETDSFDSPSHPFQWLGVTVVDALTEWRSVPHYLDSPAYENVRRLGPTVTYFGRVPVQNGILWLCPFGKDYMKSLGLRVQLAIKNAFGLKTRLQRITDIVSPQLVSQRLYGAMRRRDLCVVDWTTWSANVFYEFGVRLAVNRFATVSILGPGAEPTEQQQRLIKLLGPIEYRKDGSGLDAIRVRYEQMLEHATSRGSIPPAWGDTPFDSVYRLIAELAKPSLSAGAGTVEALLQAEAAVRLPSTTDLSSPVLYAEANAALKRTEEAVALEMLLAAWFYMSERLRFKEIDPSRFGDPVYEERLKAYWNLGDRTADALRKSKLEQDRSLAAEMQQLIDGQQKAKRTFTRAGGKPNVGIE